MDEWRCRRHPSLPGGGVCPHCLRDRLLRLCPDCACPRPCACSSSCASSPSSSSGASALGRVHSLIDRERRVTRSCSVAAHRGVGAGVSAGVDRRRAKSGVWGWVSFRKPPPPPPNAAAGCKDVEQEYDDAVALARSRSVSAAAAAAAAAEPKAGGWGRLIPGKIKALRSRKSLRAGGDWRDTVR
ncbi:hypothetical protein BAE44_0014177 [Dichanthelium oligosanthes]|uniref:Uncharacterized protein n=1 Tax=Dichanthelium oligosanthes TaxID=888268 RepID=A0A1E5VI39_9POAL|nr:hypothetical protein BAE44_0014177 [Dichanthelium oligosanthes]